MNMKMADRIENDHDHADPSATGHAPSAEHALCFRLRAARKAHGLSLVELGRRIGCSVGYLSQIERGISSPSLRIMVALADVYGVELSALFSGGVRRAAGDPRIVVRRGERSRLDLSSTGITKEALTDRDGDGVLNLYEMVIAPGGRSGEEVMCHAGEECGVLLEGRMILEVAGEVFELEGGDAFRFASTLPHRYWNPTTDTDVRILWTTTAIGRRG